MLWDGNTFLQANAEQCSKAGFDTFIERQGGLNCCPWCAGLVGVFAYPKGLPKEVFARHDNCTCMVEYTNSRGVTSQRVGGAKFVEVEYEPKRLTDGAKRGAGEPKRLTGGANGGIINYGDSSNEFMPVSPEAYDRVKPFDIFGDERDYKVAAAMRFVLDQVKGKESGTEWLGIYDYQTMKYIDGALSKDLGDVAPIDHDKPYISIHNHASGEQISFSDLYKLQEYQNCKAAFVVGNNGNCYALVKGSGYDDTGLFLKIMKRAKGNEPYLDDTEDRFFKECEKYGIKYFERRY